MKIEEIKINAYGNIKDKQIKLEEGINIVQGENESGKSTLLSYISNTFYGISKNKDGKTISDFEKYKPWNGTEYSGKISYSLDNEEKYEVYRDFSKKNPKIYNEKMEDISTNFDIDKKDGNKFFTSQTGLDKQMYLSTVVSMQQGVRLDEKNQNILVQKIANLAGTGEDNVSYKKALTKLQDKIRDEIGTSKTSQKPINMVLSELDKIKLELEKIKPYQDKKYSIDNEKDSTITDIEKIVKEQEVALKIKEINEEKELKKHNFEINEKNKTDNLIYLEKLKKQKESYEKNKNSIRTNINKLEKEKEEKEHKLNELLNKQIEQNKEDNNKIETKKEKYTIYVIIAILLAILLISNIFIIKNNILTIIGVLGLVIDIVTYLVINKKIKEENIKKVTNAAEIKNKNKQELHDKMLKLDEEINNIIIDLEQEKEKEYNVVNKISMIEGKEELLEKNNEIIESEIKKDKESIEQEINNKKEEIIHKYKKEIEKNKLENIMNSDNIYQIIQRINEELNNKKIKLKSLEIEEKNILPQLDNIVELEEKKEALNQEYLELKKKEEIINIAIENLKDAYEEMKTTITPKFTSNLSTIVSKITNGKYNNVTINDINGMIMENEKGDYIELERLSTGTIDELYLSLRLSMIDDIAKETMPIILDETFVYFDDNRLANILKYLQEVLKQHQIIILTCTNREKEILDKLEIKYNLIKL